MFFSCCVLDTVPHCLLQVHGGEIHSRAVEDYAKLTAATIELYHKFGQVLLLSAQVEKAREAGKAGEVDVLTDALIRSVLATTT